jgi:hypothetical protein
VHWKTIALCALALACAGALGCGSAPAPIAQRTDTMAALRSAEEVGAGGTPDAALHLQLAREQAAEADELIRVGRMQDAEAALERAKADAELAIALTREDATREDADDAAAQVRALRESHR